MYAIKTAERNNSIRGHHLYVFADNMDFPVHVAWDDSLDVQGNHDKARDMFCKLQDEASSQKHGIESNTWSSYKFASGWHNGDCFHCIVNK